MDPYSVVNIKYITEDDKQFETIVKLYDYSDKSIVIICDEHFGRAFTTKLKVIGKYNANLKIGKGWIFPKSKYGELQQLISDILSLKFKGDIPYDYNKKSTDFTNITGPLGFLPPPEPSIVSDFKKFMNQLNNNEVQKYVLGERIYIWGKKEELQGQLDGMSRGSDIKTKIENDTHSFVVL